MRTRSLLTCIIFLVILQTRAQVPGSILSNAVEQSLYLQCSGGGANRTAVAYNPVQELYYSVEGGSAGLLLETFDAGGVRVNGAALTGYDPRGMWYNTLLNQLEGNAYGAGNPGVFNLTLNGSYHATGASTLIFSSNQPNMQSCGTFDPYNNEIVYPDYAGTGVRRVNRADNSTIQDLTLTGTPAGGSLNLFYVFYTGVAGKEYAQYDYTNKRLYFYSRATGAYVGMSQLPTSFPNSISTVRLAYANNFFWVFNSSLMRWYAYQVVELGLPGSGTALQLDGADDYVTTNTDFDLDNKSFSIEFWCKRRGSGADHMVISQGAEAANSSLHIGFSGSDEFTFAFFSNDLDAPASYTDTNWHHWAVTYNASTNDRKIYRDGMLAASDVAAADFQGTGTLLIGRNYTAGNFEGAVDEVRIWQSELSQANIRNWMCRKVKSAHPDYSSLLGYYKLDEGTDTIAYNSRAMVTGFLKNGAAYAYSGAALGDRSAHTYGGSQTGISGNAGDSLYVGSFTGTPSGVHTYYIGENTIVTAMEASVTSMLTGQGYYGVYVVEGTNPAYVPVFHYGSNAFLTAREDSLVVAARMNNAAAQWQRASAPLLTNTVANSIPLNAQTSSEFHFAGLPDYHPGSGYALDFDGVNEGITGAPVSTVTDNFTLEGWVKADAFPNSEQILFYNGHPSASGWGLYADASGYLYYVYGGITAINTIATLPVGKWAHVALVRNSGTTSVYLNGMQVHTGPSPAPATPGTAFSIAQNTMGTQNFDGRMDEVRVWEAALTQSDIRQWMCRKLTAAHGQINNLVAYYNFDRATGSTLHDMGGLNDLSLSNMEAGDWKVSGAPLGDNSTFTYTAGTTLSLAFASGDSLHAEPVSGHLDGAHLYAVNGQPLEAGVPSGYASLNNTGYSGVFLVNGDTCTYSMEQSYTANTGVNGQAHEARASLLARTASDDASWAHTAFLTSTGSNVIYNCADTGSREFIIGISSALLPQTEVIVKDTTVYLDSAGNANITVSFIDDGSYDYCNIDSLWISDGSFSCADTGAQQITLYLRSACGLVFSDVATVTVLDTLAPVATAKNISVQVDSTGSVTISGADVYDSGSDGCGIGMLSVVPNTFTCADAGANTVTLTVADVNGNTATASAVVTVIQPVVYTVSLAVDSNVSCEGVGGGITASPVGGAAAFSYLWSNTDTTASVSGLVAGTYTVTVTDNNGCTATNQSAISNPASGACIPTWNGTGNWTDSPQWNVAPEETDSVVILTGTLTVNTDATVRDLVLENGVSLVIQPGKTLTVTGNYVNKGGDFNVQTGGALIFENKLKKQAVTKMQTFGKIKVMSGSIQMRN